MKKSILAQLYFECLTLVNHTQHRTWSKRSVLISQPWLRFVGFGFRLLTIDVIVHSRLHGHLCSLADVCMPWTIELRWRNRCCRRGVRVQRRIHVMPVSIGAFEWHEDAHANTHLLTRSRMCATRYCDNCVLAPGKQCTPDAADAQTGLAVATALEAQVGELYHKSFSKASD